MHIEFHNLIYCDFLIALLFRYYMVWWVSSTRFFCVRAATQLSARSRSVFRYARSICLYLASFIESSSEYLNYRCACDGEARVVCEIYLLAIMYSSCDHIRPCALLILFALVRLKVVNLLWSGQTSCSGTLRVGQAMWLVAAVSVFAQAIVVLTAWTILRRF